ncbi:class I SAM-dependent methyltransferase [Staphylococcus sp. 17KM0847]|uniref:class I SAM-dependent DNA methyltransferase n=1 Tax=Staphylococcus sp. 17KM0847 TaxID=2583989 RepID=UPI0015DC45BB|nr:class I SAM-dependent methyltransferase [Staphylococcus sp. 17KM0847]QLK86030.1 class I SAM-dependent methyltransferase [Staphylococcus sp. 17KM0847]
MSYQTLSHFYDQLTDDQPYEQWQNIIQHFLPTSRAKRVLDIGCGTGTLTTMYTAFADDIYGMDLSEDMIHLAQQKSSDVTWCIGDMTDFNLPTTFDLITIFCDSLNYVTDEADVLATFNHVYHHLNRDGILMFDVHTVHKMLAQFNGAVYLDDREHLTLIWQTEPGDLPYSVWHDLTFFVNHEGTDDYRRYDETQFQRTLDKEIYTQMLQSIGFRNITTFYDFEPQCQSEESDRLFFIATK